MIGYLGTDTPTKEQIKSFVEKTIESGRVIPGYGHAVLRRPDPRYVAQQKFTKGEPLSVMINGGDAPAGYKHLFFEVNQDEVVQKEP